MLLLCISVIYIYCTDSEIEEMKMRLHEEHTPALQTFREGHLEKRTEVLAQEELKTRAQLDSEMSILRGKLDAETRKGKYKAKERT